MVKRKDEIDDNFVEEVKEEIVETKPVKVEVVEKFSIYGFIEDVPETRRSTTLSAGFRAWCLMIKKIDVNLKREKTEWEKLLKEFLNFPTGKNK